MQHDITQNEEQINREIREIVNPHNETSRVNKSRIDRVPTDSKPTEASKDLKIQFATNFKILMNNTKTSTRKGNNKRKKRNLGKFSEKHSGKLKNYEHTSMIQFKGGDTLSLNVKHKIHNQRDHNMIYKSGIQSTKGGSSFFDFYKLL